MQRECPNKSTVLNVMYAKENGFPIAEFILGGEVYKFLLDTASQLSLCKESMLKHADQLLDQELLFSGVASEGRSSHRGVLNIPKVGKIWFSGVPDISLNGFDAIIGLDSGLDSVLMKDKVFSIRGRAVSYQVGVSRGQDKNAEIQAAIDKVLASFEDVFTETPYQSVSTLEPLELKLKPGSKPIRRKPIPLSGEDMKMVEDEISALLERKIIEPIKNSDWSFPMFVTKQKPPMNRKKRTVVDFQKLNDCLDDRVFDASIAEEELNDLPQGAKIFSKLDLAKGYLQLRLEEKTQEMVVVSTSSGCYKFKVLPLGLKPAVAEFQIRIEKLIGPDGRAFIKIYIDDILIATVDLETHVKILRDILASFEA